MLARNLNDCSEFTAFDGTILREILHPHKEELKIGYSLAHATLPPGQTSAPHRLKNSEIYYILQGEGIMYINNEEAPVKKDFTVYIPPDSIQHIKNTGSNNLVFICIVDPAWEKELEEIL